MPSPRIPLAIAAGLGLSWHNEGSPWTFATATYVPQAVGIDRTKNPDDPGRFDGVTAIGVDEHVWRHTRRGDKFVTVMLS